MSTSTPFNGTPPAGLPERHETSDGTVYWGDIPQARFESAAERWPVLKYVIEEYFGSPERESTDASFLARYESLGEDSSEFNGFQDDLDAAIKQYTLASSLVNGLMGISLSGGEVRTQLVALKDQLLQQGEYDPNPTPAEGQTDDEDEDPFKVNSAADRIRASFLWERELPFGLLGGKSYPIIYFFTAAVGCLLLGLLISFIPFIGGLGRILMVLGGIACFVLAVGILAIRSDYMHPDRDAEREKKKKEVEEKKKERGSFFSRHNPFAN